MISREKFLKFVEKMSDEDPDVMKPTKERIFFTKILDENGEEVNRKGLVEGLLENILDKLNKPSLDKKGTVNNSLYPFSLRMSRLIISMLGNKFKIERSVLITLMLNADIFAYTFATGYYFAKLLMRNKFKLSVSVEEQEDLTAYDDYRTAISHFKVVTYLQEYLEWKAEYAAFLFKLSSKEEYNDFFYALLNKTKADIDEAGKNLREEMGEEKFKECLRLIEEYKRKLNKGNLN